MEHSNVPRNHVRWNGHVLAQTADCLALRDGVVECHLAPRRHYFRETLARTPYHAPEASFLRTAPVWEVTGSQLLDAHRAGPLGLVLWHRRNQYYWCQLGTRTAQGDLPDFWVFWIVMSIFGTFGGSVYVVGTNRKSTIILGLPTLPRPHAPGQKPPSDPGRWRFRRVVTLA
jgi:hypothetical protein